MVSRYRDSFIVVSGLGRCVEVANLYGYNKAIDIMEVYAMFP
jgi:hypothetical protein